MRLFAAIPVDGEARQQLEALLERWRPTDWPVKWVSPSALHLTIKFLGEVAPERLDEIAAGLTGAVSGRTLPLVLEQIGGFPTLSRARVVFAGLAADPALELLVDRVERACAALGFPVEGRPFRPHVTLGRVREGQRLPQAAVRQLEEVVVGGASVGDRVVLFESRTLPAGATYHERATFPLGT